MIIHTKIQFPVFTLFLGTSECVINTLDPVQPPHSPHHQPLQQPSPVHNGLQSMTVYLNRHTGLDRTCRIRFNIRIGGSGNTSSGNQVFFNFMSFPNHINFIEVTILREKMKKMVVVGPAMEVQNLEFVMKFLMLMAGKIYIYIYMYPEMLFIVIDFHC